MANNVALVQEPRSGIYCEGLPGRVQFLYRSIFTYTISRQHIGCSTDVKPVILTEEDEVESIAQRMRFSTHYYRNIQHLCQDTFNTNGARAVQIFDSWATELSPTDFKEFSLPYLKQNVDTVKKTHPRLPLRLYASGLRGVASEASFEHSIAFIIKYFVLLFIINQPW
ncbi:hypothetical protein Lal_00048797 [Lupinus albus]|nr:hypothetical protein Lal_00048797 [Lupinus albus]